MARKFKADDHIGLSYQAPRKLKLDTNEYTTPVAIVAANSLLYSRTIKLPFSYFPDTYPPE